MRAIVSRFNVVLFSFWTDYGDQYEGFSFGAEAGFDWALLKSLGICVRIDYSIASIVAVEESYLNLQVGLGWMF